MKSHSFTGQGLRHVLQPATRGQSKSPLAALWRTSETHPSGTQVMFSISLDILKYQLHANFRFAHIVLVPCSCASAEPLYHLLRFHEDWNKNNSKSVMNAAAYCATLPFIQSLHTVTHKAGDRSVDEFLQHQSHPSPDCDSQWSPVVLHEVPLALLTSIKSNKPLSFCPGTPNLPTVSVAVVMSRI